METKLEAPPVTPNLKINQLSTKEACGVEIKNISVRYNTASGVISPLVHFSISVAPSEFICIVGPSGSGKTTLLNVVAGFIRPVEGEVLVRGKPIIGRGMDRGIVFQEYALFPWRTALKNVEFGLETLKISPKKRQDIAMHYLALVGLERFAEVYPYQLSGGMKQRVAIARALAYDPAILLMDEPFGALDAFTREKLQSLVVRIWQETGKTILYVTHNLSEAIYLGERIIILVYQGKVEEKRIKLPRPRNQLSNEFVQIQSELNQLLHLH